VVAACAAAVYGARLRGEWKMPKLERDALPSDTPPADDTTKLPYPINKDNAKGGKGLDLKTPPALQRKASLDSTLENFKVTDKVGDVTVGEKTVPYSDYMEQENRQWIQEYFKQRSQSSITTKGGGLLPELNINNNWIEDALGGLVEVRPQGSAEVIFSQDFNRVENPTWSLREQKNSQFKFDQKIQVGVQASIGNKIHMGINYDTEASFDFENQRKLKYEGTEDEILQLFEVGDVSMPVAGTLITGSTSIFGFKTKLKFGKLDVTSVFAQQKSERKEIILDAGAQRQNFDISVDNYDFNRHFFLAQYFRDNYDRWQQNYPAMSNVVITRVEVWVTNASYQLQNTHTIAAFMDMGESKYYNQSNVIMPGTVGYPDKNSNTLYKTLTSDPRFRAEKTVSQMLGSLNPTQFTAPQDYYVLSNARQLRETDFTFDPRLGYISLSQTLNPDDVLAVAFEYTINGVRYQVGEFAADVPPNQHEPNVLFLKMLKSVNVRPRLPIWDLMMKNIYSLGAYQVDPTDFRLQVVYADDRSGADLNYIPEPSEPRLNGKPLIRVMQLDRFNTQLERKPDGNFDYLEGVTIVSNNGRIIFPVLEPFGTYLYKQFNDQGKAEYYTFQALYDSTRAAAQQLAQKNKFFLRGSYQGSAGSEISLNAINVQQGSVRVTANGIPLVEGSQYTVDYALGRVRITDNSVLNSGAVIKVESESNTLFNIQQKTLMGTRAEYHINKDFTLGSTILYLKERPLTPKVNIGDEPIRNAIWGVDGSFRTDSRMLTRLVDRIPLIQTKEKSEVAIQAEFAQIIPGHPSALNDKIDNDKGGVSYLDDFEGSQIPYDLRLGGNQVWTLASVPQDRFPEGKLVNKLAYGFNRAKLSWYTIDNSFFRKGPQTPQHWDADKNAQSNHYMREVTEQEVFPNREIPNGSIPTLQTLDLVYRPKERGPYNFTVNGLDPNTGELIDPKSAWAGISRRIEINDFEASNIEFLEFWLMDPFHYDKNHTGGDLYIDLGNISEDILRDDRKSWENGLPKSADVKGVDTTAWGRVPNGIQITNAFDNDPNARKYQDVGYDGLTDEDERSFYDTSYLKKLPPNLLPKFLNDPAGDDFKYFLGDDYDRAKADVLERYKDYNNTQGNTPTSVTAGNGYGSQLPDDEDINKDFNIDKVEEYFEYHVRLSPSELVKDRNYVTDSQTVDKKLANGNTEKITWYQFKVPIRQFTKRVGSIPDFKSIRFMRMYLTGFDTNIVLRFAQLQFLRSDWRKYLGSLASPIDTFATDPDNRSTFEVSAVNIEENGKRPDIPYVLPPGIKREQDPSTPQLIQQNEQSLSLKVCDLKKDDARAVFKNTQYDTRQYKRLKMFVHAENSGQQLPEGAVSIFVRIGTDFVSNYYEYEMPLAITKHGSFEPNEVWPDANMINIALSEFYELKERRNANSFSQLLPFSDNAKNSRGRVTVIGNPDLSNIRTLMIGLRNTYGMDYPAGTCIEVWANELRVTDFDERGGWAATGRMTTKLADFGRVELSGTRRTIGFGSIEQTLQQRSQQDMRSYGVITALELGKFFPQRYNVRVPMYFAYSEQINRPKYNPLSPDLPLSSLAEAYSEDKNKYDSVLRAAEDFTARKSLNFTGVQKMRNPESKRKPHLYDIENFTGTYIFQEVYRRNISSTYDFEKLYTGRLGYSYTFSPKPWTPLSKIKNKNLKLLSDFNLYFLPQSYAMQGEVNRKYAEKLYRNTDNIQTIIEPLFDKNFTLDRTYDLRYNLSKSLRLSYSAKGQSRVEEPYGRLDTREKRDTVKENLLNLGTLTNFSQSAQLAYDVPINKLPFLDFITLQTSYTGNYDWHAAPPAVENLGNVIQNSQVINVNNTLNMITLYNKSKYLKNIVQGQTNKGAAKKEKPADVTKPGETPPAEEEAGKPVKKTLTVGESLIGVLLSFRSASLNYTLNNSTALPGFRPEPQYIGQDFRTNSPGLPFIFGSQKDVRERMARDSLLTFDTNQVAPFIQSRRENIIGSGKFEPFRNFQITIDFSKQTINSFTENWRYDDSLGRFQHFSPVETGSYTISYAPWRTSFKKDRKDHSSELFDVFESNRMEMSRRLSERDPLSGGQKDDSTGYYLGYGPYHQDVLIPAFLSAYTGRSRNGFSLSPFPKIPAPAWRISYNGLSNIKAVQAFAKTVSISHGYRSTYSADNFQTSLGYNQEPAQRGKELVSKYRMDRVTIQERFEPLFGIDVTWENNIQTRFEMRKDRTLALSFSDRRLAEQQGKELVFGAGYRTNHFILPLVRVKRKKVMLENDLNFRLDFSVRDQIQVVRILDTDPQVTGGQRMLSFTPNISYVLTQSLTLNIFVKHTKTTPHTSNLYPTSFTSVGFSLRYVLSP
jgi:cell surface protein SprA